MILAMHGQVLNRKPPRLFDLFTSARLKFGLHANAVDYVQTYGLLLHLNLQVAIGLHEWLDIETGLFENFASCALGLGLVLVHFSFREAPRRFRPETLHEQHIATLIILKQNTDIVALIWIIFSLLTLVENKF